MKKRKAGFSIIELMIIVGIVGVLSVIAKTRFDRYQISVRQVEAKAVLQHLFQLTQTYEDDYGYDATLAGAMTGGNPKAGTTCSDIDHCNQSNVFGFKVKNCVRANYSYHVGIHDNTYEAIGQEFWPPPFNTTCKPARTVYTNCNGGWNMDLWYKRRSGLIHAQNPSVDGC